MYPTIRLEAPGLTTLTLDPESGRFGQKLDLGDAVTREVADDAPDADGTDDLTEFFGARNVTLSIILYPETGGLWALKQQLRAFTHPKLRPTMFVQQAADAPVQQVTLRRSQYTDVIGDGPRAATQADQEAAAITVQWVAPLGILESEELHQAVANAAGEGESGFAFDVTFDLDFGVSEPLGAVTATNAGTADVYPLIRIYGPCTDPTIENVTQDKALAFTGLTIGAGEFLEVDTRNMTVFYQGDPSDPRYDTFDWPAASWWTLSPGDNQLRLAPDTFDPPSNAVVEYRDAWL